MSSLKVIVAILTQFAQKSGSSLKDKATEVGIGPEVATQWLKGLLSPTDEQIEKIITACGGSMEDYDTLYLKLTGMKPEGADKRAALSPKSASVTEKKEPTEVKKAADVKDDKSSKVNVDVAVTDKKPAETKEKKTEPAVIQKTDNKDVVKVAEKKIEAKRDEKPKAAPVNEKAKEPASLSSNNNIKDLELAVKKELGINKTAPFTLETINESVTKKIGQIESEIASLSKTISTLCEINQARLSEIESSKIDNPKINEIVELCKGLSLEDIDMTIKIIQKWK